MRPRNSFISGCSLRNHGLRPTVGLGEEHWMSDKMCGGVWVPLLLVFGLLATRLAVRAMVE